jgi:sortase A
VLIVTFDSYPPAGLALPFFSGGQLGNEQNSGISLTHPSRALGGGGITPVNFSREMRKERSLTRRALSFARAKRDAGDKAGSEIRARGRMNIRTGERILLAIGLTLLAVWAVARLYGSLASRAAIERFRTNTAEASGTPNSDAWDGSVPPSAVDFTLWNPKRVIAYKDSLAVKTDLPLAILRIPKIRLEAPVFNDTDDLTLNRGVGRILGTAHIGQPGNLGIAGHRDGFFRGLQDVGRDDLIELIRPGGTDQYVVVQTQIVNPENVSVLAPTTALTLTLVTCYPFYYVGNAPQRYVVTASYQISSPADESATKDSIPTVKKTSKKEK